MTTYYARNEYVYSGSNVFSISFSYLSRDDVKVYINEVATTDFEFITNTSISIDATLTTGDAIRIMRSTTSNETLVTFTDQSLLKAEVQNLSQDQLFYLVQEIYDAAMSASIIAIEASNTADSKTHSDVEELANTLISSVQNMDSLFYDSEEEKWINLPGVTASELDDKEDISNKTNSFNTESTTTYPSSKALYDGLESKFDKLEDVNTLDTSGTITLTTNSINRITTSGQVTFSLPSVTSGFNQILVQATQTTVGDLSGARLGTTKYFNKVAPTFVSTNYTILFEHNGINWVVGAIATGDAA